MDIFLPMLLYTRPGTTDAVNLLGFSSMKRGDSFMASSRLTVKIRFQVVYKYRICVVATYFRK